MRAAVTHSHGRQQVLRDDDLARVADDARRDEGRYSSGWFCTLCSVAYSSVSLSTTGMPSPYA